MRLGLIAVGRLKEEAEARLFARYWERLAATGRRVALDPQDVVELKESTAATAALRTADEAARLLAKAKDANLRIVLDEAGRSFSSAAFAEWLAGQRDQGIGSAVFLIGGPDGHGSAVRAGAGLTLSLGPMTLPHGLARIVLAEQLYRAATILAGHPYHRE